MSIAIKIIALIGAGILSFLIATSTMKPMASVPGLQKSLGSEQICTLMAIEERGFPLRVNLYDGCRQDNGNHPVAAAVNTLLLLSVTYGVYVLGGLAAKKATKRK